MSAVDGFTADTEFTRVDINLEEHGREEWPTISILIRPLYQAADDERLIEVSMDEARHIISGLAGVVR